MAAVLGLYRVGGLRYSEALLVQWRDVDFVGRRLLVHSPKTSRIRGRGSRVIPLFPRLRELLEELWETVPENGSPYVISENRTTIRKHVDRIVFYAGLNRWERLIQNLRSSCAIDVQKKFGDLAESEWIGHSPQTAKDHYLHVLDSDFEEATRDAVKSKDNVI
ncbi:MAG: tyrosine-type recombinase/integrase [Planctomycetia bacterium]|nr:tyrosine-type recombinase/integrase [Planctomycetia bacterium]